MLTNDNGKNLIKMFVLPQDLVLKKKKYIPNTCTLLYVWMFHSPYHNTN